MLKLLFCLGCGIVLAMLTLQLRQQQLELRHQAATLQHRIEGIQSKLWRQQVQVSIETAPNVVAKTLKDRDMGLVPQTDMPAGAADWINSERPVKDSVSQRR
jgi:hypothetical protein